MIDRIQRRMTVGTVCVLLAVCLAMLAALNGVHTLMLARQVNGMLDMLMEMPAGGNGTEHMWGSRHETGVASTPHPYCTVRVKGDGGLQVRSAGGGALYDEAFVQETVRRIQESGKSRGCVGTQAFSVENRGHGTQLVLLDVSGERAQSRLLLKITLATTAGFFAVLSLLSALLIRRMMRPIREAFDKQQQFVWDASHELKTPLAVISANAQVLEREIGRSESVGYILSEVKRTSELVSRLLMLARMDAGRQEMRCARFDLSRALMQAALPMESLAFEMGRTLRMEIPEGVNCTGDEALLVQMTVVLLSNALKYAGKGGVVTLSLCEKGRAKVIRVHNTGSYMPPEVCSRVFDRFYRAEDSRSRDDGGAGLGLSIAQSIARMHRGEIHAVSDREQGTAFIASVQDVG